MARSATLAVPRGARLVILGIYLGVSAIVVRAAVLPATCSSSRDQSTRGLFARVC